jgi:hypothetical protein
MIAELESKLAQSKMEIEGVNRQAAMRDELINELELRLNESQERIEDLAAMAAEREAVLAQAYNTIETGAGAATNADEFEQANYDPGLEGEESLDTYIPDQVFVPGRVSIASEVDGTIKAEIATQKAIFMTSGQIGELLHNAGINPVEGTMQKIESVSGTNMVAHRWDAGDVYGTAEQKLMDHPAQYQPMITSYLEQAKSRCEGDFAAIPANKIEGSEISVAAYEIACVADDMDSSASLMFVSKDGIFTTIAHETSTDNMDVAMDFRDSLMRAMSANMATASAEGESGQDL